MTAAITGFSSAPPTMGQQQPTSIRSVDLINMKAQGYTRQQTNIVIDLQHYVGAVHVIPSEGDMWLVRRFGTAWVLVQQLPYNATEISAVKDTMTTGMVQVGSTNPNGLGPLHLNGSAILANAPLGVKAVASADRPSAATAGAGSHIFDTSLGKPIWSNGSNWVDSTGAVV
jgi:hypothetical protein